MITSSGKQSDKEVETSIVHLMQMYMFVIEVLQKSKYHYQHLPGTLPGWPWALAGLALEGTTALWSGKESVQSVTLTMQPFAQSQSKVTAVSRNLDQSKPNVHFNSHFDPYI